MDGDAMAVRAARSAVVAAASAGAPRSVLGPGASAASAAENGTANPGPAPSSAAFSTLPYVAGAPRAHPQASGNQHQNLRNILSDPALVVNPWAPARRRTRRGRRRRRRRTRLRPGAGRQRTRRSIRCSDSARCRRERRLLVCGTERGRCCI
jgi:hypothetical protein